MQRFVPFACGGRGEMRAADGAGACKARLEPAPQAARLWLAAKLMERDQHAAEIVVAGGRQPRTEANEALRSLIERVADEPALDRIERRLRVAAQRIVLVHHEAAEPFARHAAARRGLQRSHVRLYARRKRRGFP